MLRWPATAGSDAEGMSETQVVQQAAREGGEGGGGLDASPGDACGSRHGNVQDVSDPFPVPLEVREWNEGTSIADSCALYFGRFISLELIDALDPPPTLRRLLLLWVDFWEGLLRQLGVDAQVTIDAHPLIRGHHPFTLPELRAALEQLRNRYPDHALLVRDVHADLPADGFANLQTCGFRLVGHSISYVVPADVRFSRRHHRHLRDDLLLLKRSSVSFVPVQVVDPDLACRLALHYEHIYRQKHSLLHPRRDAAFFEDLPAGTELMLLQSAQKEVVGFYASAKDDHFLYAQLVGFFSSAGSAASAGEETPHSRDLYRLVVAHQIQRALDQGLRCWLGSGKRPYKLRRGALPTRCYLAVYTAHLPIWRRLGWWLCSIEGWLIHRLEAAVTC